MRRLTRGFTLIESVVVIVIMGLAMITMSSFIFTQVSSSGDPQYQSRAAALGQGLMTQILARSFDEESDENGGAIRCSSSDTDSEPCTGTGVPAAELGPDEADPNNYNDVDDYIGCWEPNGNSGCNDLNDLIGDDEGTYRNFRVTVDVSYINDDFEDWSMKRIDMTIQASNQPSISFTAFRGNY